MYLTAHLCSVFYGPCCLIQINGWMDGWIAELFHLDCCKQNEEPQIRPDFETLVSCITPRIPITAKYGSLRLPAKFHLDRIIVSPFGVKKKQIWPYFQLQHSVEST